MIIGVKKLSGNLEQEQQCHQYDRDIVQAVVTATDNDLNKTAPEDLSVSYMNIGNSTVEVNINAANIKTFDFRPSKQIIK